MTQPKITEFFAKPKKAELLESNLCKNPAAETSAAAADILAPLFVRKVPEQKKYQDQLAEEFRLIDKNKFVPVFLQVRRILDLIRQIGEETQKPIPFVIRGSAGSSLVCYLLGITHVDPVKHEIQLARFMNDLRKDCPDCDIDICYNRREEVFARIAATWPEKVARVSNYCLWSNKTAQREVTKEILKEKGAIIPAAKIQKRGFKAESLLEGADLLEAETRIKAKLGTLKNYSKHCAGIVIFEDKASVPEELKLKEEADETGLFQLNLNKDDTEDAGLIKIDLLSNRALAQLADICPENRPLTEYPTRDAATERLLANGHNIGLTLAESRGMRKLFMEMRPEGVGDIAIAQALIRPAAAAEGRKQEFLQKYKQLGKKALEPEDKLKRPIIYDDDAIVKVQLALGCSAAEADRFRKGFAKGDTRKVALFRREAAVRGISCATIDEMVADLNNLVYYSFCKSHAVSYGQLVWALAYWKAHRPHEFWLSALNHCHSEYRHWVHYREARCAGILLTRSRPPYRLGKTKDGKAILLSEKGGSQQALLKHQTPAEEFKELGYWLSEEFMPSCGVQEEAQQRLDGLTAVRFRGLIACGRTISRDWGAATLICIGTGNREYYDIVIPEKKRGFASSSDGRLDHPASPKCGLRRDLFGWAALEGRGVLQKGRHNTIEVSSIHGVSISALSTSC